MPEENFEQQARKLAEPFRMEPPPVVWKRVKAAIAPPKKRRRTLLWWWLLPLCIAGGVAGWLLKNTTPVAADKVGVIRKESKIKDSAFSEKSRMEKAANNAMHNEQDKNSINSISDVAWQKKKGTTERKKESLDEQNENQHGPLFASRRSEKKGGAMTKNDELLTRPKEESHSITTSFSSSENTLHDTKNSRIDSSSASSQNDDKEVFDTIAAKAIAAIVSTDSTLNRNETAAIVKNKKKATGKSYSIGLLGEVGTASLGSPLSGSKEKSSQAFSSVTPGTPGSLFDLTSGTVTQYKIISGVHLSLGLSAQKKLSKRVMLTGQATYRYQQFGISQTIFIDTTNGGLNGNAGGNSNPGEGRGVYHNINAVQRLHFVSAYAGIGWQFMIYKRSALSLQAGVDNAFLLSITQKQNGSADSVKSLSAHNFYRWQPSVQLALPFESYLGKKIHFKLSPFVRFGMQVFQKNSGFYKDNRLSSAGVQAIYFFK